MLSPPGGVCARELRSQCTRLRLSCNLRSSRLSETTEALFFSRTRTSTTVGTLLSSPRAADAGVFCWRALGEEDAIILVGNISSDPTTVQSRSLDDEPFPGQLVGPTSGAADLTEAPEEALAEELAEMREEETSE